MDTDTVIFFLSCFMLFIGWLAAYLSYREKLARIRNTNRNAREHLKSVWFNSGWESGVNATLNIVNESERRRLEGLGFTTKTDI